VRVHECNILRGSRRPSASAAATDRSRSHCRHRPPAQRALARRVDAIKFTARKRRGNSRSASSLGRGAVSASMSRGYGIGIRRTHPAARPRVPAARRDMSKTNTRARPGASPDRTVVVAQGGSVSVRASAGHGITLGSATTAPASPRTYRTHTEKPSPSRWAWHDLHDKEHPARTHPRVRANPHPRRYAARKSWQSRTRGRRLYAPSSALQPSGENPTIWSDAGFEPRPRGYEALLYH